VFDRRFFPDLMELRGDRGGQVVVNAHPDAVIEVSLAEAIGDDVDRPEDWPG
jgi:CTP:molybdopterin cytidylyltransferase MocA